MKILALETANDPGSVALWRDGVVTSRSCPPQASNSETLLPIASALLGEAGLGFADLDAIAFGAGPGSFTGLRVACGVAQGLAVARGLPLLPINTLAAMAAASGAPRVVVALDARMGEVYYGVFVDGELVGEVGVHPPQAVPLPPGGDWLVCGNGSAVYPALREWLAGIATGFREEIAPSAEAVLRLAAPRLERGETIDAADAVPLYVRDKVARTVAERLADGGRA